MIIIIIILIVTHESNVNYGFLHKRPALTIIDWINPVNISCGSLNQLVIEAYQVPS